MTSKQDGFKMTSGGKQGGCFTCEDCGKKTRDTGNDEASAQLCLRCLNSNFMENLSYDSSCFTEAQLQEMKAIIAAARSGAITSKKMASELKRFEEIAGQ